MGLFPYEISSALKVAKGLLDCEISNRKLVLINLAGGNDGLNTIIPYRNSIYFSQRPNISIKNSLK